MYYMYITYMHICVYMYTSLSLYIYIYIHMYYISYNIISSYIIHIPL